MSDFNQASQFQSPSKRGSGLNFSDHFPGGRKDLFTEFQSPSKRGSGLNCRVSGSLPLLVIMPFQSPSKRGSGLNSSSSGPPTSSSSQAVFQSPSKRGSGLNA